MDLRAPKQSFIGARRREAAFRVADQLAWGVLQYWVAPCRYVELHEVPPRSASPILRKNALHRGSACRERSRGLIFVSLSPASRWVYARSSHSKARAVSPRAAYTSAT